MPCPSGGFPRTCSGAGSIRCATTARSAATYLRNVPKPQLLLEWADQQRSFAGPVLIIWARHDKLVPPAHAQRLVEHFGNTQQRDELMLRRTSKSVARTPKSPGTSAERIAERYIYQSGK